MGKWQEGVEVMSEEGAASLCDDLTKKNEGKYPAAAPGYHPKASRVELGSGSHPSLSPLPPAAFAMSLVLVQLGQCGNQLGQELLSTVTSEVQEAPKDMQEAAVSSLFRFHGESGREGESAQAGLQNHVRQGGVSVYRRVEVREQGVCPACFPSFLFPSSFLSGRSTEKQERREDGRRRGEIRRNDERTRGSSS
jgi:hypothetical protein